MRRDYRSQVAIGLTGPAIDAGRGCRRRGGVVIRLRRGDISDGVLGFCHGVGHILHGRVSVGEHLVKVALRARAGKTLEFGQAGIVLIDCGIISDARANSICASGAV